MRLQLLLPSLLFFICLYCNTLIFAQYENVWVFGNYAGIDFNSGTAKPFATNITSGAPPEANASVCDANGKFLFYTDGYTVYNRNYDTMANGYRLVDVNDSTSFGVFFGPTNSTMQGALIVPMPGSLNKYYIFSLTFVETENVPTGSLLYSVVNMELDNGLGGIDPNQKGILVDMELQEKMISIIGDRCNVWVLTCGYNGRFKTYEITESGLNTKAVVSSVGMGNKAAFQGMIASSPNRKKIACVQPWLSSRLGARDTGDNYIFNNAGVALFDFDAVSGIISNPVTLLPYSASREPNHASDSLGMGVCFSPDNSKLYYSATSNTLFQFDLSSGNPLTMANSITRIGGLGGSHSRLKLAPDGKIYFTYGLNANFNSNILGRIASPNLNGAACQFLDSTFNLLPGEVYFGGLPNVISVFKRDTIYSTKIISECDSSIGVSASDTLGWDYIWDDGSYGANRSVNSDGTYWLQYRTPPCIFHHDTFMVTLSHLSIPIITVNGFDLSVTKHYDTYQWYLNGNIIEGATDSAYSVTENGDYTVKVTDPRTGCTNTSALYKVTNVTGISNINSLKKEIRIYPNPLSDVMHIHAPIPVAVTLSGIDGRLIKEKIKSEIIDTRSLPEGLYFVRIYNLEGLLLKVEKVTCTK